jgi:hypothetical protein
MSFFLQNGGEEILEIAAGISIAKQGKAYILNCGRKFFCEIGEFKYFKFEKKLPRVIMNIGIVFVLF